MTAPPSKAGKIDTPELIFGIVGPIGVNLDAVIDALMRNLADVGYRVSLVHLTQLMAAHSVGLSLSENSYFEKYISLIKYANEFRRKASNAAVMAGLAIAKIREIRGELGKDHTDLSLKHAYIIRQFKRREEIDAMRRVYGRKFIQVSVFGSQAERREVLIGKIRDFDASPKENALCEKQAIDLTEIDYNQRDDENGQRISEIFHLGDVFVEGINVERINTILRRFIRALFGDNGISPNKDEYGLYAAAGAALRSIDLSRQVGAAIFTKRGEIISLGCNEVPKPGGGTYWTDDPERHRDFEIGRDPNQSRRNEIVFDFLKRLDDADLLTGNLKKLSGVNAKIEKIFSVASIRDSQMMDIIEFNRVVHAEMSALADAARLGRPTEGTTLFCTTFPCHMCAKHIVAAGIRRVVFLEPYPKSSVEQLYRDSITFEEGDPTKVLFQPFIGISPRRYRDIFEKGKRKDSSGKAREWFEGFPAPMIEDKSSAYIENEDAEIALSLTGLTKPTIGVDARDAAESATIK